MSENVLYCGIRGVWKTTDGWIAQVIKYVGDAWDGDVRRFVLLRNGTWQEYFKGSTFDESMNLMKGSLEGSHADVWINNEKI